MPDVVQVARDCQHFGADGITVHPRPDERHITYKDVKELRPVVYTEFNIEGYPNPKFIQLVLDNKPEQVTLVPDPPGVLTSNAGWDTKAHKHFLQEVVGTFKEAGIRVSLFMETDEDLIAIAAETGTDRIELYTESYAQGYIKNPEQAVSAYRQAAIVATEAGLGINAGHDLNLDNLKFFADEVPGLLEVSIGHALISDALYLGLENTIQMYQRCLRSKP